MFNQYSNNYLFVTLILLLLTLVLKVLYEFLRWVWDHGEQIFNFLTIYGVIAAILFFIYKAYRLYKDEIARRKYNKSVYGLIDENISWLEKIRAEVTISRNILKKQLNYFHGRVSVIPQNRKAFHEYAKDRLKYLEQVYTVFSVFQSFLHQRAVELKHTKQQLLITEDLDHWTYTFEEELVYNLNNWLSYTIEFEDFLQSEIAGHISGEMLALPIEQNTKVLDLSSVGGLYQNSKLPVQSSAMLEEMFQESDALLDEFDLQLRTLETIKRLGPK